MAGGIHLLQEECCAILKDLNYFTPYTQELKFFFNSNTQLIEQIKWTNMNN